jgi:alkyl hydroperoxide reductase subunit AhpF
VQALPAGEALLAVESSAMFVLIGSMPHTAWLAGQIPPDGKAWSYRSIFEIGRAGAFAIGAVSRRPAS